MDDLLNFLWLPAPRKGSKRKDGRGTRKGQVMVVGVAASQQILRRQLGQRFADHARVCGGLVRNVRAERLGPLVALHNVARMRPAPRFLVEGGEMTAQWISNRARKKEGRKEGARLPVSPPVRRRCPAPVRGLQIAGRAQACTSSHRRGAAGDA